MPRDTVADDTTRPSVPEQLDERLADAVTEHVRIPGDRLTFADRLRVLLEEYDERGEQIDERGERIDELERAVEARDEKIETLQESLAEERNTGLVG
jgi:hypothetical protein